MHEYTSGSTSTPKAELFCSCKRRKFIGQEKSKFVNYKVKILSFKFKKLVALISTLIPVSQLNRKPISDKDSMLSLKGKTSVVAFQFAEALKI